MQIAYSIVVIKRFFEWAKLNKLLLLIVLIFIYFAFKNSSKPLLTISKPVLQESSSRMALDSYGSDFGGIASPAMTMPYAPVPQEYTPNADIKNRMVVQNSYLSLLVTDVVDVRKKILGFVDSVGGYMVNSETVNPQDAPTATVTVRVPSEKLNDSLEMFRGFGVKVVSENLTGSDVTDQYVDVDARIETLEKTKAAMEEILARAVQISDLSNITREIISIQSQIDGLKGSQKSLSENSKLAKVTIYLSTDEIALPYAPTDTFRPQVILKLAVRSLVGNLRQIASFAIWAIVYSVIWLPILIAIIWINRRFSRKAS